MALIKIHALFTIRQQRWLTRQVAVENGQVVRTSRPAQPDEASPEGVPA
jgi:hyaluronan synthase